MRTQFIVSVSGKEEREQFFDYIVSTYNFKLGYPFVKKAFIDNKFPFVVDFADKSFWISDSITCCACAAQAGVIIDEEEFKKRVQEKEFRIYCAMFL